MQNWSWISFCVGQGIHGAIWANQEGPWGFNQVLIENQAPNSSKFWIKKKKSGCFWRKQKRTGDYTISRILNPENLLELAVSWALVLVGKIKPNPLNDHTTRVAEKVASRSWSPFFLKAWAHSQIYDWWSGASSIQKMHPAYRKSINFFIFLAIRVLFSVISHC